VLDSLRARLLAAFLLPTLALLTGAGFLGYRASRSVLEEELGASLSGVAAAVSTQLSAERLLTLTAQDAEGEGSRTFRTLSRQLNEARTATHARRIVAFAADGHVLLDSGGSLPIGAQLPELARDRLELSRVLEGKERSHSQVLFEGNDGELYKTGYAPLLSEGKAVGAVAVEGSAEFFGPLRRCWCSRSPRCSRRARWHDRSRGWCRARCASAQETSPRPSSRSPPRARLAFCRTSSRRCAERSRAATASSR
jgi:hypothetical protein